MNRLKSLGIIISFGIIFLCPFPIEAIEVKFPKDTDPAFVFTSPDDCKSNPDGSGNMILKFSNQSNVIIISMLEDEKSKNMTLEELRKSLFSSLNIDDSNKSLNAEISGKKGRTYIGTIKIKDGNLLDVKLTIVKLDESKAAAAITTLTTQNITPYEKAVVEELLKSMKITSKKELKPFFGGPQFGEVKKTANPNAERKRQLELQILDLETDIEKCNKDVERYSKEALACAKAEEENNHAIVNAKSGGARAGSFIAGLFGTQHKQDVDRNLSMAQSTLKNKKDRLYQLRRDLISLSE